MALVFGAANFIFATGSCGGVMAAAEPDGWGVRSTVSLTMGVGVGTGVAGALLAGGLWNRLRSWGMWRPGASLLVGGIVGSCTMGLLFAIRDHGSRSPVTAGLAAFYATATVLGGAMFAWPGLVAGELVERIERSRQPRDP